MKYIKYINVCTCMYMYVHIHVYTHTHVGPHIYLHSQCLCLCLFEGTLVITVRFLPGTGVGDTFRANIHRNAAKLPFSYVTNDEEDEVNKQKPNGIGR